MTLETWTAVKHNTTDMSLEDQIARLVSLHDALEKTKISVEKEVKKLRSTVQWLLGLGIPIMIVLVGGVAELRARESAIETKVQTINQNYTPFELVAGLQESNDRLINALISANLGDPNIRRIIAEYKEFNSEALRKIQSQLNITRGGK